MTCPPELAYGDQGYGDIIPPGSTLIFEVAVVNNQRTMESFKPAAAKSEFNVDLITAGWGKKVTDGNVVNVEYTGKLSDGTVFDSSKSAGKPYKFTVGQGQVIKCWDMAMLQIEYGQRAILTCPAKIAYGRKGSSDGAIPPDSTLTFEIKVLTSDDVSNMSSFSKEQQPCNDEKIDGSPYKIDYINSG